MPFLQGEMFPRVTQFPGVVGKKNTTNNGGTQTYFCIDFLTSKVFESNEHIVEDQLLKMQNTKNCKQL